MLFKKKIVVLDVETTGFNSFDDDIIEVGLVVLDGNLDEVGSLSMLVKPFQDGDISLIELPKKIVEITGITDDMINLYGEPETSVQNIVKEICDDAIMVYHNAEFDSQFVKKWGVSSELFYDTLSMSRGLNTELKSHKLGDVVDYYHIQLDNAHRAVNDARATAKLFKAMIEKFEGSHKEYLNTLVPNPKYGVKYQPSSKTKIKEG